MSNNLTISLTPAEAKIVFNTLDGQADAGACEGGNTEQESEALNSVMHKLLAKHSKWRNVILEG